MELSTHISNAAWTAQRINWAATVAANEQKKKHDNRNEHTTTMSNEHSKWSANELCDCHNISQTAVDGQLLLSVSIEWSKTYKKNGL